MANETGYIMLPKRIGLWSAVVVIITALTTVAGAARHAGQIETRIEKIELQQIETAETNKKVLGLLCMWCSDFSHDASRCETACGVKE